MGVSGCKRERGRVREILIARKRDGERKREEDEYKTIRKGFIKRVREKMREVMIEKQIE